MAGSNALRFLSNLHSAFSEDALSFVAFRLSGSGDVTWRIAGDSIECSRAGAVAFSAKLSAHTIASLIAALVTAGFTVTNRVTNSYLTLSAVILMDGEGSTQSPAVMAYSSTLWAIGEAIGAELALAGQAVDSALLSASMDTSGGEWLDYWASHFGVVRRSGEADDQFGRRIVTEVVRPRSNNVAIEIALGEVFGQEVTVEDVREWGPAFPKFDGAIEFDGAHQFNVAAVPLYGLFDVGIGYDLEGGPNPTEYLAVIRSIVDRMRAAGTFLRDLNLTASSLSDAAAMPIDAMSMLSVPWDGADAAALPVDGVPTFSSVLALGADAVPLASDSLSLTISYARRSFDGSVPFDGSRLYNGAAVITETVP